MNFLELAKKRCSVRMYETKKVEAEKLEMILEAGRIAPTAANFQPQRLIVVQKQEGLEKLHKCTKLYEAPLAIIICGDHETSWKRSTYDNKDTVDIDTSIVTDHMMLQAEALGLSSVWICHFNPELLKKEFNIPDNVEAVSILAIGYAAVEKSSPDRHEKVRKPLSDIVHYETY